MIEFDEIIAIHNEIIRESGGESGILFAGLLQSCLEKPLTVLFGYPIYQDLFEQISALMHCIILNHPFVDGNKRTGLIIAKVLFEINGLLLNANTYESVHYTLEIAQGNVDVMEVADWLRNHSTQSSSNN
jgi:death-on-curing protein